MHIIVIYKNKHIQGGPLKKRAYIMPNDTCGYLDNFKYI